MTIDFFNMDCLGYIIDLVRRSKRKNGNLLNGRVYTDYPQGDLVV